MSQRECAGFNWPPLAVPAEEPVSISPEAVRRAGPINAAVSDKPIIPGRGDTAPRLIASVEVQVGQPARCTAWLLSCSPRLPPPRSDHDTVFACR